MSKRAASQELEYDPVMAKKFSHLKITSHEDIAPAQDFALSILEDRKLAQYVLNVSLNYTHWAAFPAKAFPYTATTEAELEKEARFKAAIAEQKWEEEEASELLKRLMTTSSPGFNKRSSHQLLPDAVVALLLPILPNVQKWAVGDIDRPKYVGKAIQRAADGIFGSISVTHLEILTNNRYGTAASWAGYGFPAFKIFRNLPFLERISGKGIGGIGIEDAGSYSDIPNKASAVREIHLKDCELSGSCLSKIINFSTGLRAFTYRFGGRSGDGGTAAIYTPELAKALTPHRSTIQSLDIDFDSLIRHNVDEEMQRWQKYLEDEAELETKDEDEDEEDSDADTLDSAELEIKDEDEDGEDSDADTLDSADSKASAQKQKGEMEINPYFPNLTHLRIGIKLASIFTELSGKKSLAEWLPASLEKLQIVGYRPQESTIVTQQIEKVVQQREELLPNLKIFEGVEEYIECGKELLNEDDYVESHEIDE
jgi:hypothetical protein